MLYFWSYFVNFIILKIFFLSTTRELDLFLLSLMMSSSGFLFSIANDPGISVLWFFILMFGIWCNWANLYLLSDSFLNASLTCSFRSWGLNSMSWYFGVEFVYVEMYGLNNIWFLASSVFPAGWQFEEFTRV